MKLFCYMTKKSRQKFKYLENEKSFWGEIKSISHHFKGLSITQNCLRSESAPLKSWGLATLYKQILWTRYKQLAEAATRGVLQKKLFLEISQNWQKNTCARVSFLIKLQTFFKISADMEVCVWILGRKKIY